MERVLYPRMQKSIYGPGKPYITEDERKLSETDLAEIKRSLRGVEIEKFFNFLVTRIVPDRFDSLCRADRAVLRLVGPMGGLLAGRVLLGAHVRK